MTTLAIIGSGIAGRSLIYTLAKEKKSYDKIILFSADNFTSPCSLNSTAIVAPRGLTYGHSPLGDLLLESFKVFSDHVEQDSPSGVQRINQIEATTEKRDAFLSRYPNASEDITFFHEQTLQQVDRAYMIDPGTYLNWLLAETKKILGNKLELISDLVTEVLEEKSEIKTLNGKSFTFDKVVFAGGSYNRFWNGKPSKPVQGSYYEWSGLKWTEDSFSITLNGENLIWNKEHKRLFIGSTSLETSHLLAPSEKLKKIHFDFSKALNLFLPDTSLATIRIGLREKAPKRMPYVVQNEQCIYLGGFYKNGFSLGLKMARETSRLYLWPACKIP